MLVVVCLAGLCGGQRGIVFPGVQEVVAYPADIREHQDVQPRLPRNQMKRLELKWRNRLERKQNRLNQTQEADELNNEVDKMLPNNRFKQAVKMIQTGNLCRDGSAFCDKPLHYPDHMIAMALRKEKKLNLISPLFDAPKPNTKSNGLSLRQGKPGNFPESRSRTGLDAFKFRSDLGEIIAELEEFKDDQFENVCDSTQETIVPRVGTNTNNQQRYLVNAHGDLSEFKKLVRTINIVRCLGSQESGHRESCGGGGGLFGGRRTECRQEYTQHKMVALDQEAGELVVETFSFPSCCSCMVHRGQHGL